MSKKIGREMEEKQTTNKRDPWPTHLFDCCSGSILFSSFSFCQISQKKGEGVCEKLNMMNQNIFTFSFLLSKIHFSF